MFDVCLAGISYHLQGDIMNDIQGNVVMVYDGKPAYVCASHKSMDSLVARVACRSVGSGLRDGIPVNGHRYHTWCFLFICALLSAIFLPIVLFLLYFFT